jgi:hypothetical protein
VHHVLSLPDAAKPGARPQPPATAIMFSLAPDDPAALLSTGRNFGLSSSAVVVPHKPILFSFILLGRRQMYKTAALFAPESIIVSIYTI